MRREDIQRVGCYYSFFLFQGYVREIEELRAQLLEANAMYEASRKREAVAARARHDSTLHDTASVIDDAKRELYKVTWLMYLEFRSFTHKVFMIT